jgi:TRAP-type transport system periplasmic protein
MRYLPSIAAAAIATGLAAGPADAQQINARLGHCTAEADSIHQSAALTKAAFERLSGGKLTLTIFPSCQLGSIPSMIEQLQLGTLDMFPIPPAFGIGTNRNFSVPDAPGLFDDIEHASRALQNPMFRDKFVNIAKDKGLMVTSVWVHSGTSYASSSPIRKIDDFKGKKIRVLATKVETDLMGRYGATGVPIEFSQLLPALQQKTVDAARSSIVVMGGLKYFTVTKYLTLVNDAHIPAVMFVGTQFYNKLPADLQKVVIDAGKDVEKQMPPISVKLNKDYEKIWTDNGAEIIRFAPADQAEVTRRAAPVGDEVIGGNPETKDLYAVLKQSAEATRKK